MKRLAMVGIIATAAVFGGPGLTPTASAQSVGPIVVGAALGATVGAFVWPVMAIPAAAGMAGAAATIGPWDWNAYLTTRAAVGAVVGGSLAYVFGR